MQKSAAYLIVGQRARALAFEPTQQRDAEVIPLYTAEQLRQDGWRQCAQGQRLTQWCPQAEVLQRRLDEAIAHLEELLGWEGGAAEKYKLSAQAFLERVRSGKELSHSKD